MDTVLLDLTGTKVGHYRVERRLSSGGMGEVYLARDTILSRPVAVKRISPRFQCDEAYQSLLRSEAEKAIQIHNEHVTAMYHVLEHGSELLLVMEYVEGVTLRERMEQPVSVEEFRHIALECGEALRAAHEKHLIHRDIKPENIMLTRDGNVKLCDFGVARQLPTPNNTTAPGDPFGNWAGTPAYMAPEVLQHRTFDARADIFSLGVLFYEALTGKHPFAAESVEDTYRRICETIPVPIRSLRPDVPPDIEAVVTRMLIKNPEQRLESADALLDALKPGAATSFAMRLMTIAAVIGILAVTATLAYFDPIHEWFTRVPIPEKRHVVVIPFQCLGGNAPSQYSCEGLTDIVTTKLTGLTLSPNLQVIPSSEVRVAEVRGARDARNQFGANLVVTASVYGVGEETEVLVGLIETASLKQVRSISFRTEGADTLTLINRITDEAVQMLELTPDTIQQATLSTWGTRVAAASDAYVEGVGYLAARKPENTERAIQLFQSAIAQDSKFAAAYAQLGSAYWTKYIATKEKHWIDMSKEACGQGMSIDPDSAASRICLGAIHLGAGDYNAAAEEFERARDLEPTNDEAYRNLGRAYERMGNLVAAEAAYRKAVAVKPHYWYSYIWIGQFLGMTRNRYEEARRQYMTAISLASDNQVAWYGLCSVQILQGRYSESIESCRKSVSLQPTWSAYQNMGVAYFGLRKFSDAAGVLQLARELNPRSYKAAGHLARAYHFLPGQTSKSRDLYEEAIRLAKAELEVDPKKPDVNLMVARYYAMLGDRTRALSHLQIAFSGRPNDPHYQEMAAVIYNQLGDRESALTYLERSVAGGYSPAEIGAEAELDELRENPRYRALLR